MTGCCKKNNKKNIRGCHEAVVLCCCLQQSNHSCVSSDVTASCNDGAFYSLCQSGLPFLYPPSASQLIDYKCSFACKEQSLRLNNKI